MSEFEDYIGLFNTFMIWYRNRYTVDEKKTMFDDIDEDIKEKQTNHATEKFAEIIFTYKEAKEEGDKNLEPVMVHDADLTIYQNPYILLHNEVPREMCQHILPLFLIVVEKGFKNWEIKQLE